MADPSPPPPPPPSYQMKPQHAAFAGASGVYFVAKLLLFNYAIAVALVNHTSAPVLDFDTAMAIGGLLVWGVGVWALRHNIVLPPVVPGTPDTVDESATDDKTMNAVVTRLYEKFAANLGVGGTTQATATPSLPPLTPVPSSSANTKV